MAEHWNGGTGGKGSKPRPFSVSQKEYDDRFDAILGKKKNTEAGKFYEKVIMKNEYVELDEDKE